MIEIISNAVTEKITPVPDAAVANAKIAATWTGRVTKCAHGLAMKTPNGVGDGINNAKTAARACMEKVMTDTEIAVTTLAGIAMRIGRDPDEVITIGMKVKAAGKGPALPRAAEGTAITIVKAIMAGKAATTQNIPAGEDMAKGNTAAGVTAEKRIGAVDTAAKVLVTVMAGKGTVVDTAAKITAAATVAKVTVAGDTAEKTTAEEATVWDKVAEDTETNPPAITVGGRVAEDMGTNPPAITALRIMAVASANHPGVIPNSGSFQGLTVVKGRKSISVRMSASPKTFMIG